MPDAVFRITEEMLSKAMPLGSPMTASEIVKQIDHPQIRTSNVAAQIKMFIHSGMLRRQLGAKSGAAYTYVRLRDAMQSSVEQENSKFERKMVGGLSVTLPKMPTLSIDG